MPPPDAEDDAALIERSWHDPEAFAGLYDRHAAPLHRYAARRLGGGAADDIVADTFLDAFRRVGIAPFKEALYERSAGSDI